MRSESADDHLGGRAMLNALSTAMFALVLQLASETHDAPRGLLALACHPRRHLPVNFRKSSDDRQAIC
jgi:AraC family transcriptional activator of mtrCDE